MTEPATFTIRRAELRDVRDIRAIDARSFTTPWSEKLTISQVTDHARVHFVVERAHRVVGHGGLVFLGGEAHIASIAVSEATRGQGVGDLLMNQLLRAATDRSCSCLTLEVRASNDRAIALYARHGLDSVGRRPGYYADNGEDAIIMTTATSADPSPPPWV